MVRGLPDLTTKQLAHAGSATAADELAALASSWGHARVALESVADLALTIAEHRWELVRPPGGEPEQGRYLLHLSDGTSEGLGEEVGGTMVDEDGAFLALAPALPLAGSWTLASFSDHVAGLDVWPEPPELDMARRLRRWAFESAALDLALAQNGRSLAEALGRAAAPAPVRFVNSLPLGDPPALATIGRRLERYPALRFKLDAQPSWSASLIAEVAATGAGLPQSPLVPGAPAPGFRWS